MASGTPLKKDFGEGGLAGRESRDAKEGRDKMAISAKAAEILGEAQKITKESEEKAQSWLGRLKDKWFGGEKAAASAGPDIQKLIDQAKAEEAKLAREAKQIVEGDVEELEAREEMYVKLKGKAGQKMVGDLFAYKGKVGEEDEHGEIGDVRLDEERGELRVDYEDGSSLRKFPSGLVLRILPGGQVETLHSVFMPKKPDVAPAPKPADASVAAPKKPDLKIVSTPDTPKLDPKEALKALEDAKTPAQLRAVLMDNRHLKPEDLARLSDAELETMRLKTMDELDGGNREVTAEIEAEQGEEVLTFAEKLEARRPADKARLLAERDKQRADKDAKTVEAEAEAATKAVDELVEEEKKDARVIVDESAGGPEPVEKAKPKSFRMKSSGGQASAEVAGEIGGEAEKPKAPHEVDPDLPKPAATIPPGVMLPTEKPPAVRPEKPKNPYDQAMLVSLEEELAERKEDYAQNPDPKEAETIAQMEESIAKRNTTEGLKSEVASLESAIAKAQKKLETSGSEENLAKVFKRFAGWEHEARGKEKGFEKDAYIETLRKSLEEGSDPKLAAAFAEFQRGENKSAASIIETWKRQKETLEGRLNPSIAPLEEKPSEEKSAEKAVETATEQNLNPLDKSTMELVVNKTDELGLGETYKKVTEGQLVKALTDSDIKVELGKMVSAKNFHKMWKEEMEKRKKDKGKKK